MGSPDKKWRRVDAASTRLAYFGAGLILGGHLHADGILLSMGVVAWLLGIVGSGVAAACKRGDDV